MPTDAVCGMELDEAATAAIISHEGQVYRFCSEACSVQFSKDPEAFIAEGQDPVEDPVCGMRFKRRETPFHRVYKGTTYRFCSQECYDRFVLEPERYAYPKEVG